MLQHQILELLLFDVVVTDNQNPTVSCPSNITKTISSVGVYQIAVNAADGLIAPTYGDNCAVTSLEWSITGAGNATGTSTGSVSNPTSGVSNPLNGYEFLVGTSTVTYTVYDAEGNSEDCSFTITINSDPSDITISESAITTYENQTQGAATFTVVLPAAPTGNVCIDVTSDDDGEGKINTVNTRATSLASKTICFTTLNWNTPQTIYIFGINDNIDDDDQAYSVNLSINTGSTDAGSGYYYATPGSVSATNTDDDTAGLTASLISGVTTEAGGTATFTMRLNSQPVNDVTFTLSSSDATEGDVTNPAGKTVTFTSANWNSNQTITVTGINDDIDDGNIAYQINISNASSVDPKYNGLFATNVNVTNNDNDTAGFTVSAISNTTSENATTATFTVRLNSKPATDGENYAVVVNVVSNDEGEGTVDKASLTFDHTNWNVNQTVTVTGVNDDLVDGNISYSIELAVNGTSTTDAIYDLLNPADVSVTNTDNDAVTLAISSPSVLEGDAGTTALEFTVTQTGFPVVGGYTVSYYTNNGTAKTPTDFAGGGSTVSFSEVESFNGATKTITININGDNMVEPNETFTVVLNTISGLTGTGKSVTIPLAGKTGTGTILNDDSSSLSIDDVSVSEGNSGTKTLTFTATLTNAVELGVKVDYATADGTSTDADNDYDSKTGTLTFTGTAGETKTIGITINGDTKVELNELFTVVLSNVRQGNDVVDANITIADNTGTGTITNDDSAVLSVAGTTVTETSGGTTANFTVSMNYSVQGAFTIDFATSDNTAATATDYTTTNTTLSFGGANALTQTVSIPILDNNIAEATETFYGTISNKVDALSQSVTFNGGGASAQATMTIQDNDVATLAINNVQVTETSGGTTATFTVTLSGNIEDAISFNYATANIGTANGHAIAGSDYTLTSGSITFEAGSVNGTEKTITVPILDGVVAEPTETYYVNLSGLNNASQSGVSISDNQGLGTILDNDAYTISIAGVSVNETDANVAHNFVATMTGTAQYNVVIRFTTAHITTNAADITAQSAQSYTIPAGQTSVNIPVTVLGDQIAEPVETFTGSFVISNANGQQITVNSGSDTGTITDDDSYVINLTGIDITETDGNVAHNFVATMTGAAQYNVVLSFTTTTGTAVATDFTGQSAQSYTITAGQTSVNIPVTIIGDNITEPVETFTGDILITNANGQPVTINTGNANGRITDDDPTTIAISGFTVDEDAGTADFTVTLNQSVQNEFTVDFATSNIGTAIGHALAGSLPDRDYDAESTTLTFGAANPLSQTVTITIHNDNWVEPVETLRGTISNLQANSQAITIATATATGTINDNESASVAINNVALDEDEGPAVFTVTLTGNIQDALTVDFETNNGTAVQPSDYTLQTGTVTFPAGSISGATQTITIVIGNDLISEPLTETFTVDLDNIISSGSASISDNQGVCTITDEDPVTQINLSAFTNSESDVNVSYNFVATMDKVAQEPVVIRFSTTEGSAKAGSDFTAQTNVEYTILPGTNSVNIPVVVIGDNNCEPQESFTGTIALVEANGQIISIGTHTATATVNDDDPAVLSVTGFDVDEDAGTANFTVALTNPVQEEISVTFQTVDNTALNGVGLDYTEVLPFTMYFGDTHDQSQTVTVTINNDSYLEPTEQLIGRLSSLSVNSQAVTLTGGGATASNNGIIQDNDPAQLTITDQTITEGGNITFTITLSGDVQDAFTIDYTTADATALTASDYTAQSGTLSFTGFAGEFYTITVPTTNNSIVEPQETFELNFSDISNALVTYDAQAIGTIQDNDEATITLTGFSVTETDVDQVRNFTVAIDRVAQEDIVVGFSATPNTAVATNDYVVTNATVTITAGNTTASIPITITGDDVVEPQENFSGTISVTNANGQVVNNGTMSRTITVNDDDAATIAINSPAAATEGNGITFTVTLTGSVQNEFTIDYITQDNSAEEPGDYTAIETTTLTFGAARSASQTFTVTTINDTETEPQETFFANLQNLSTGGQNITNTVFQGTGTINDNDQATLTVSNPTINENGTSVSFSVSLTGTVKNEISIDYATANNNALAGSDYLATNGTLYFGSSNTSPQTVTVNIVNNAVIEPAESFYLNFTNLTVNGQNVVMPDAQGECTINDDDSAVLTISDRTVNESAGTASLTVSLSGNVQNNFTVQYSTANNTAVQPADYTQISATTLTFGGANSNTQTVTVTINNDNLVEADENMYVNLSGLSANGQGVTVSDAQGVISITDNDNALVSIAATDNVVDETGSDNGVYTVTLSNQSSSATTVSYSVSGTATSGTDFTALSGTVTIPANTSSAVINLTILTDVLVEANETVIVTLTGITAGDAAIAVDTDNDDATITIPDNDNALVSIAATDDVVDETGSDNGVYTVTLSNQSSSATTVSYSVSGTATSGTDFTALSGTVTIPANTSSAVINLTVLSDALVEANETVIVTLSAITAGDAAIAVDTDNDDATITIPDNDNALASIAATDDVVDETGSDNGVYTVTLSSQSSSATTVSYSVSGTATSGTDYTALSGTVTIPANTGSATIALTILTDALVEADETVIVTLTGITAGDAAIAVDTDNDDATITIPDNDNALVSIAATDDVVDETGSDNGVYTVTLSNQSSSATTVSYSVSGTATRDAIAVEAKKLGPLSLQRARGRKGTIPDNDNADIAATEM